MRANTKGKHEIRKRFAILIGVAAVGVMALGAQTGAQTQAPTPPGQAPVTCNGLPAEVVGTDGPDQITTGSDADVIATLGGNDTVTGTGGNDVVCGGPGKDTLKGNGGADTLLGQKGNDTLLGGGDKDHLLGQAGNDTLNGGPSGRVDGHTFPDFCKGGKGTDTASGCEVERSI